LQKFNDPINLNSFISYLGVTKFKTISDIEELNDKVIVNESHVTTNIANYLVKSYPRLLVKIQTCNTLKIFIKSQGIELINDIEWKNGESNSFTLKRKRNEPKNVTY